MKKQLFLTIMLAATINAAASNTTEPSDAGLPHFTYVIYGDIPNAKTVFEEEHYLGGDITAKWNTFLCHYTAVYDVEIGLANSGTKIRKPAVYRAVDRANRYVRKALRSGEMTEDEAVATMTHILDCANVIYYEEQTDDIEAAARQAKTGKDVIELFKNVELQKL